MANLCLLMVPLRNRSSLEVPGDYLPLQRLQLCSLIRHLRVTDENGVIVGFAVRCNALGPCRLNETGKGGRKGKAELSQSLCRFNPGDAKTACVMLLS